MKYSESITLLGTALAIALAGCRSRAPAGATATVDTLPSGIIHVTNPRPAAGAPDFELVEDLRIGRLDGDGPDVFGEIRDRAVDTDGRHLRPGLPCQAGPRLRCGGGAPLDGWQGG